MNKQRIIVIIISALGIVFCFLPWYDNLNGWMNGWDFEDSYGYSFTILFTIVFILSAIGDNSISFALAHKVTFAFIGCILCYECFRYIKRGYKISQSSEFDIILSIGLSYGTYLLLCIGATFVILALAFKSNPKQQHQVKIAGIQISTENGARVNNSDLREAALTPEDMHSKHVNRLTQLHQLLKDGILSQAEYDQQKALILASE